MRVGTKSRFAPQPTALGSDLLSGSGPPVSAVAIYSGVASVMALVSWSVASSLVIFSNRYLMVDKKFPYPMLVTAMGQLASAFGGYTMTRVGLMTLRSVPSARDCCTKLLPLAVMFALTLFLGNHAYLHLSLSFIQMLKALTPALTLMVGVVVGIERLTLRNFATVSAITVGTAIATAMEATDASLQGRAAWIAFIAFLVSAICEACRLLMSEVLLGTHRFNSAEVMVYIGPPTAALLLLGAASQEQGAFTAAGWATVRDNPALVAFCALASFFVNLTTFLAIRTNSSLILKMSGCVKNAAIVGIGALAGDVVKPVQLLGYALSVAAFLYSVIPARPKISKKYQ